MDPAVVDIDNIMRAACVEADVHLFSLLHDRDLDLITVSQWVRRTYARRDIGLFDFCDPLQGVDDALTLRFELSVIGKMHQLASTACAEIRARWLDSERGGLPYRDKAGAAKSIFYLRHDSADRLTRQGAIDEKREAMQTADPFAVDAKPADSDLNLLIDTRFLCHPST